MVINFKKNIVVGVSVTPEMGLEVAQIDFSTKTVLKYASKQLAYDNVRKEISDLDIFKETLTEIFTEFQLPKGTEVVLTVPPAVFKVTDYPASLTEEQVNSVIEEELLEHNLFRDNEPGFSAVKLPNSTIQFNKVAHAAVSKTMLIEIAMQIKELGYTLIGIDTSVNSMLNALIYNSRVNTEPDFTWLMLVVENNCCRIIPMQGKNYVEYFEERISIGEVLGDDENYSTVVNAVMPIIKNLPAQCLYVVSKTNVISAKALASKLTYSGQIIHEEANYYANEPFIEVSSEVPEELSKFISLDVIGAGIYREFFNTSNAHFNLYNMTLGDIFLNEQPPVITIGGIAYKLSLENMIKLSIFVGAILVCIAATAFTLVNSTLSAQNEKVAQLDREIAKIKKDLDANANISTEIFDEGDEIRIGVVHNKNIFTYYQIVGTEIPKKLWLTSLELGKKITIKGQADNLESIYSFFRSIKDYNPQSGIKLQSLGLATKTKMTTLSEDGSFDTDSILTTLNADFYDFVISDDVIIKPEDKKTNKNKNKGFGLEPLPGNLE